MVTGFMFMEKDKTTQLLELRSSVIKDTYDKQWKEVWFFPMFKEVPEVNGYLGTKSIMFVAFNPSFGKYPEKKIIFYYQNLKDVGFFNAHLTDCFKIKKVGNTTNKSFDVEETYNAIEILKKEISIISPKMIVCVGRDAETFFKKNFSSVGPEYLPHYSQRIPGKRYKSRDQFVKEFTEEMQKIRNKYDKILQSKTNQKSL